MGERPSFADEPVSEAVAAIGLILNVASVIAIAISLASWGASQAAPAAGAGIAAVLAFVASIICFGKQAA